MNQVALEQAQERTAAGQELDLSLLAGKLGQHQRVTFIHTQPSA